MYHPARTVTIPAPLDFNAPVRTESVADALVSEPALPEGSRAPAPESLLAELGLPARTVTEILASSHAQAF